MKRRGKGKPYYPLKEMALLAVMMFMSLSERGYVNWLKTNTWLIELAELANTPDRRSIKRVFERTPLEYWERLEAEIQKIIEAMIWSFKCIVGDIVRFRKNKNILVEIILKKCIFNAVWYVRRCL